MFSEKPWSELKFAEATARSGRPARVARSGGSEGPEGSEGSDGPEGLGGPGGLVQSSRSARSAPSARWPAVGVAAVSSVIVLRHIGTKPLWKDEAVSLSAAERPLHQLLSVLPHSDANAGVYYLLLHEWMRIHQGTAWARDLSAVCFIATAALVAWAATRWAGPWLGTCAGLLIATNEFLVYYGQEARPYSLAVLLAAASTAALFWERGRPAHRAYAALTIALVYVDLFAVLFAGCVVLVVGGLSWLRSRRVPSRLVRDWTVIALASLPLALLMIVGENGQIDWILPPPRSLLGHTYMEMGNGVAGTLIVVALLLIGLVLASGELRVGLLALAAGFVIPPAGLWVAGQVWPCYLDRYVLWSTLGAVGAVSIALLLIRQRSVAAATVVMVILVGLGGWQVAKLERQPFKQEDPRAAVQFISARALTGDDIGYAHPGLRTVMGGYVHPGLPFPTDFTLEAGPHDYGDTLYALEADSATIEARLGNVDRMWLVTDSVDGAYPDSGWFHPVRDELMQDFQREDTASFGTLDVSLLVRRV
jgi:mannosyltransferase